MEFLEIPSNILIKAIFVVRYMIVEFLSKLNLEWKQGKCQRDNHLIKKRETTQGQQSLLHT